MPHPGALQTCCRWYTCCRSQQGPRTARAVQAGPSAKQQLSAHATSDPAGTLTAALGLSKVEKKASPPPRPPQLLDQRIVAGGSCPYCIGSPAQLGAVRGSGALVAWHFLGPTGCVSGALQCHQSRKLRRPIAPCLASGFLALRQRLLCEGPQFELSFTAMHL